MSHKGNKRLKGACSLFVFLENITFTHYPGQDFDEYSRIIQLKEYEEGVYQYDLDN